MKNILRWGTWVSVVSAGMSLALTVPVFAQGTSGRTLTMEATAYGPSAQDNYPYGATDYFGQPLTAGDIAVDPSVIPLRTCLYVTGYHSPNLPSVGFIGEADDEGGAIQGLRVDLFMNASPPQVSNFGIQRVKVTVLGPAHSTSASGSQACASYMSRPHGSQPGAGGRTVGSRARVHRDLSQTGGAGRPQGSAGNHQAVRDEETDEAHSSGFAEHGVRSHLQSLSSDQRWWRRGKRQPSYASSPLTKGRTVANDHPWRTKA